MDNTPEYREFWKNQRRTGPAGVKSPREMQSWSSIITVPNPKAVSTDARVVFFQ